MKILVKYVTVKAEVAGWLGVFSERMAIYPELMWLLKMPELGGMGRALISRIKKG